MLLKKRKQMVHGSVSPGKRVREWSNVSIMLVVTQKDQVFSLVPKSLLDGAWLEGT